MSGDRLVVSYDAIAAAHGEAAAARTTVEQVIGGLKAVGSQPQHARKLDHALSDYASRLHAVGIELSEKLGALATFLGTAERYYRYVDETALTRAIPYDPAHPSPTMIVSPYGVGVQKLPPGVPDVGGIVGPVVGPRPHQVTGTTVLGVPSGPDGSGRPVRGPAGKPDATSPMPIVFDPQYGPPAGDGVDLGSYVGGAGVRPPFLSDPVGAKGGS